MALSTQGELTGAIADWLNRSDLVARIPDFIRLIEARIQRVLRDTTVVDDLTLDSAEVTLPEDCAELRSLYLVTSSPQQDVPITIGTMEMLAESRANTGGVAGRPFRAAVQEGVLYLVPAPDATYTARVSYYGKLVPLDPEDEDSTNVVLEQSPDLYLFGALVAAEMYLKHDERMPLWKAQVDEALAELRTQRQNRENGASLGPARLGRVFGGQVK